MLSRTSIAIVGGGLSGLYAAYLLEQLGIDYVLLEAQDRSGDRLLAADHQGARVDLGATWFWPEIQPELWALVQALQLPTFRQPEAGDFLIDASPHLAPRRISAGTQESTASMLMAQAAWPPWPMRCAPGCPAPDCGWAIGYRPSTGWRAEPHASTPSAHRGLGS